MVLTFHIPILMCLVERRSFPCSYGVTSPRDEDYSSSRLEIFVLFNVSVASIFLRCGGGNPTLNPPAFSSGLGTGQGGVCFACIVEYIWHVVHTYLINLLILTTACVYMEWAQKSHMLAQLTIPVKPRPVLRVIPVIVNNI